MADAPIKITPGGMAIDAAGNPADMPRELAHQISHGLLELLTLMHCAMEQIDLIGGESDTDADGMTSADSRATSLLLLADRRAREMASSIRPYV